MKEQHGFQLEQIHLRHHLLLLQTQEVDGHSMMAELLLHLQQEQYQDLLIQ